MECNIGDNIKNKLCKENGVKLIYFTEEKFKSFVSEKDMCFANIQILIGFIKNNRINLVI